MCGFEMVGLDFPLHRKIAGSFPAREEKLECSPPPLQGILCHCASLAVDHCNSNNGPQPTEDRSSTTTIPPEPSRAKCLRHVKRHTHTSKHPPKWLRQPLPSHRGLEVHTLLWLPSAGPTLQLLRTAHQRNSTAPILTTSPSQVAMNPEEEHRGLWGTLLSWEPLR